MGHLRLGRLPLRHNWRRVVETIESADSSPEKFAGATAHAATAALEQAAKSAEVTYPFWLLTQLAADARSEGAFAKLCAKLGIEYSTQLSALDLTQQLSEHVSSRPPDPNGLPAFADAALQAFQRCLL